MEQDLGLVVDATVEQSSDMSVVTAGAEAGTMAGTVGGTVEGGSISGGEVAGTVGGEVVDQGTGEMPVEGGSQGGEVVSGGSAEVSAGVTAGEVSGGEVAGTVGGDMGGTTEEECTTDCVCEEPTSGGMCVEETETHTEVQAQQKDDDSCNQSAMTSPLMFLVFFAFLYRKAFSH